jgi:hypothetical protein
MQFSIPPKAAAIDRATGLLVDTKLLQMELLEELALRLQPPQDAAANRGANAPAAGGGGGAAAEEAAALLAEAEAVAAELSGL